MRRGGGVVLWGLLVMGAVLGVAGCGGKTPTPGAGTTVTQTSAQRLASVQPPAQAPASVQADAAFLKGKSDVAAILPLYTGVICSLPSKAAYELDKVLQKNPTNAYALGLKALALSQIDQHALAFDAVTTAIMQTSAPQLYGWRALLLLRANNASGALRDAEYALSQNPQDAVACMVRGQLYLRAGQTATGCTLLQEACTLGECSGMRAAVVTGQCAAQAGR